MNLRCSICMSTRNKSAVLRNTLLSIYAQDVPFAFETIVVDDGSTDNTRQVCAEFPGVRYIYLENPRYRNPSVARNTAFRAARGEVFLAQSDDVRHVAPDTIEQLVNGLNADEFLLARTHNYIYDDNGNPAEFVKEYCGPSWMVPYFFLGAIHREHVYAVGGYDEEFVEPCFDDNWFANCLTVGLRLSFRCTTDVIAHHQQHGYEKNSHVNEVISKNLYEKKVAQASRGGSDLWVTSEGPWTPKAPEKQENIVRNQIPKQMNFFWAGEKMSWMRYMTLYSFRRYNPDWQIFLYTMKGEAANKGWTSSETQDTQTYRGEDYSCYLSQIGVVSVPWESKEPMAAAHACDTCQWEILAMRGGFYADMDVLWTAPIPYNQIKDANAVFCLSGGYMVIGFIGASPKNELFANIQQMSTENYSPEKYQSTGAEAIYRLAGVWPQWDQIDRPGEKSVEALKSRLPELKIHTLPDSTIYPFTYQETQKIFLEHNELPNECIGIHWFGGNNLSQEWNNLLTHENFHLHSNTYIDYSMKVFK